MSSSYEFWLCDDFGAKLILLKDIAFASYTRTTQGYGTIHIGVPYNSFKRDMPTLFQVDWRIDVWRSPAPGFPKRREASFFLRKFNIYQRKEDKFMMIEFFGRSPLDILRRFGVYDNDPANLISSTNYIDDMMKEIVSFWIPPDSNVSTGHAIGEWSIDADVSLGPSISYSFWGKNILDILEDLKAISISKHILSSANNKIFFDLVEGPGLHAGFGYIFKTFAGLRGTDRTKSMIFSIENGNLQSPSYYENYLDEYTESMVFNSAGAGTVKTAQSNDAFASRWNYSVIYQETSETDANIIQSLADKQLNENEEEICLAADFLNTPGGANQPRSLYGVDWDLGDLVTVSFAGRVFEAEVAIIYVSLDENGKENILGSTQIGTGMGTA